MPLLWTCPQGHLCEKPAHSDNSLSAGQGCCPICGSVAIEQVPTAADNPPPATVAFEAVTLPPRPSSAAPTRDWPTIPGYVLLSVLGRGGMGIVYKARQVKLNRLVALKMILAGSHAGEEDLARFRLEAEAVAAVQHANIVQIYEIGESEGRPFFSLEFVEGGSLADHLKETHLKTRQAAQLVEVLARAMHVAHKRGLVHRDLKPANVLMTEDGTPKITDFGLAKKLDVEKGQTRSGAIMGTPSYMAPEQAGGKKVGPAADTYALGAILYQLVTGRPPFQADTPVDTVLQVISDDPVPPRTLRPRTPRDLETICLKCLQKEPNQRYATAAELAEDLHRFQVGEPIRARPIGITGRFLKWTRRRPALASLFVFIPLVLILAGVIAVSSRTWFLAVLQDSPRAVKPDGRTAGTHWQASGLAVSRDGTLLAAADKGGTIQLWDAKTGTKGIALTHGQDVTSIAFHPDGKLLASTGKDHNVKIWDVATGKQVRTLLGHTDVVACLAFNPKGDRLASASEDKRVIIWDPDKDVPLNTFTGHQGKVHCLAFSPDGVHVASGNTAVERHLIGGVVQIWEAKKGGKTIHYLKHKGPVYSVAFSPDGKRLASAGADDMVRLWDTTSGAELFTYKLHKDTVYGLAFSPDGKLLASASADRTVHVWDSNSGTKVFERPCEHSGAAVNVAFWNDGRQVVSIGADLSVKVWDADNGQEISLLKSH